MENNSNQLNRQPKFTETFESSIVDSKVDRFLLDKSLYKGIKQNQVSKIIDMSKDGGNVDQKKIFDEQAELELILVETRKKYDEIKTNSKKLETDIEKQRKLIELLRGEEVKLQDLVSNTKGDFSQMKMKSEEMNSLVESRVYDLDICKFQEETLKHDILIFKKRNFDKDLLLKKERIQLKSLRGEEFTKTRLSYRCRDMLESIEKTVQQKHQERTSKINSFYDVLNKKYDSIKNKEIREKEIEDVMIRAMSDKLQEEKEWINICHANVFLKKFLKLKMERIIGENHIIENAFHKIKISTDVIDSKDFISRFLNREKNYGTLLESISIKESTLEELKEQKEKLEIINRDLTNQADQINQLSLKGAIKESNFEKIVPLLEKNLKEIETKKELMLKWSTRFQCVFFSKLKEEISTKYNRNNLPEVLGKTLKDLKFYVEKILSEEKANEKIYEVFLSTKLEVNSFEQNIVQRNNRVKTMSAHEESMRHAGNEDRDVFYDDISEIDFLQHNRRTTKKNDQSRRFRIKTKPNQK